MANAIEYALMAGASYISNRAPLHRFPVPEGWSPTKYENPPDGGGFEAISFTKGTQVVISFAGTDFSQPGADFINGNIPNFLGNVADQLKQAARYYLQMKALYPAPGQITLTGHSLGGCLASLIGVFFGETAFTFDQAPGRAVALSGATTLRDYLLGEGYSNTALNALNTFIANQTAQGGIPNEGLVTNMNVQGEIVSATSFARIGNETSIPHGTPFNALDISFAVIYTEGDGLDTVLDSDGVGSITMDGATLNGGKEYGDQRVHRDANKHLYVQVDDSTLIVDGKIIVKNYIAGESSLELTMTGPVADINPVTTWTIVGDIKPAANDSAVSLERSAA